MFQRLQYSFRFQSLISGQHHRNQVNNATIHGKFWSRSESATVIQTRKIRRCKKKYLGAECWDQLTWTLFIVTSNQNLKRFLPHNSNQNAFSPMTDYFLLKKTYENWELDIKIMVGSYVELLQVHLLDDVNKQYIYIISLFLIWLE